MSHRIEDYIITITTFEYRAFDMPGKDYLYDATPQQCCEHVWKKCPSANFIKMTEFGIKEVYIKHIDRVELKKMAMNNPYANGHDVGMGSHSAKRERQNKTE